MFLSLFEQCAEHLQPIIAPEHLVANKDRRCPERATRHGVLGVGAKLIFDGLRIDRGKHGVDTWRGLSLSPQGDRIHLVAEGHGLVVLVGDEPYYGRVGFRPVPPGQITVTNNSAGVVTLNAPSFTGSDAAMFSLTGTFPVNVPGFETVSLPVVFTPTGAAGLKTATLNLPTGFIERWWSGALLLISLDYHQM